MCQSPCAVSVILYNPARCSVSDAEQPKGPELARAALEAALRNRTARAKSREPASGKKKRGYSGAGPDPRDPAKFGDVLANLVKTRGWEKPDRKSTRLNSSHLVISYA